MEITGNVILRNNIFYNSSNLHEIEVPDLSYMGVISTIQFDYNNIELGISGVYNENDINTIIWGEGNIDSDPLFTFENDNPYSLDSLSLCIDTGIPDTTGLNINETDLIGNIRIWDGNNDNIAIIDMGAYEFNSPQYNYPPEIYDWYPSELEFEAIIDSMYFFEVSVEDDSPLFFSWFIDNIQQIEFEQDFFYYTFDELGDYEVKVVVSDNIYDIEHSWLVHAIENSTYVVIYNIKENLYNYPNPFKPSGAGRSPATTISFSIPNDCNVELSIYNIKGQNIKTLFNNKLVKGDHSIIWNGDDENGRQVAAGLYFYKLNLNGKTKAVKKCILLK